MFFSGRYKFENFKGEIIESLPDFLIKFVSARSSHVPISNLQPDRMVDDFYLYHIPHFKNEFSISVIDKENSVVEFKILPYYQVSNGGIQISTWGETGIENLYAVGEVTGGMHGGDRVGGMMICSAIVFGKRVANKILENV